MVHQCILYVYSTIDRHPLVDMIQFYVRNECPVSTITLYANIYVCVLQYRLESTTDRITPSETVTLSMYGGRNGIAAVHGIDERLSYLLPVN